MQFVYQREGHLACKNLLQLSWASFSFGDHVQLVAVWSYSRKNAG